MKLSILICSLASRYQLLLQLLGHLDLQIYNPALVQVIHKVDNKEMSTGAKRNWLLQQAKGEYIVFIDDDDWVPAYYVKEMLIAANSGADCFAINGTMTTDGGYVEKWRISKDYPNTEVMEGGEKIMLRTTNHITGVLRKHALKAGFPDKSNAEDKAYTEALHKHLKTEYVIEKPMYHYRFETINKEYK